MAGDWIKVRKCVLTHPRLVRIMSALDADKFRTLGGLVSAWCLLDEHSVDGKLEGYTPESFDEMVGFPGIARAMEGAGWLAIYKGGLQAPDFEKHNGSTAKRRAQETVRKMSARNADKCPQVMRTKSGPEKRREEKRTNTPPIPPRGVAREGAPARAREESMKRGLVNWRRMQPTPESTCARNSERRRRGAPRITSSVRAGDSSTG